MPTKLKPDLMPAERSIYKVTLARVVTTQDEVTRYIAATSQEQAEAIADAEATAYDSDCPDDATCTDVYDCESWGLQDIDLLSAADAAEVPADEIIEEQPEQEEAAMQSAS